MYTKSQRKWLLMTTAAVLATTAASAATPQAPTKKTGTSTKHAHTSATRSATILTLDHLKNATYRISDLSCGYTPVQLHNGSGETDGVKVVFGRAVFGYLPGAAHEPLAAVHIAYCTPELGWLQQIAFICIKDHKLVQAADYVVDDQETLEDMSFDAGHLTISTLPISGHSSGNGKVRRFDLADTASGYMLQTSQWDKDASGKLTAHHDLAPYVAEVEDRIGRCWAPTNRDRSEHVVVAFTIQPSGQVGDVRVSDSSEVSSADQAAMQAVQEAAPFPPLPATGQPLDVSLEFQAGVSVKQ